MKTYSLTPRMQVIADFVQGKKIVADIGCDHGKISIYLAQNGAYVHAVDISAPSLKKAKVLAKVENVLDRLSFYCDDGLDSIRDEKLDAVIIAGMGWRLIGSILDRNIELAKKIDTIILQPMDSAVELRKYMGDNNYEIVDEKLVWDDGRLYTVFAVRYGKSEELSLRQALLGPRIIENEDELIDDLIKKQLNKRAKILSGLNKAKDKNLKLIEKVEQEISELKLYRKGAWYEHNNRKDI